MLDTGCAKTSIDKSLYDQLIRDFNQNQPQITKVNIRILSCTKKSTPIEGMCKLRMFLRKKPDVYRDFTAMVVENLSEDLIIGYDLISSHMTRALSKDKWIMINDNGYPDIAIPIGKEFMDPIKCNYMRITQNRPIFTKEHPHCLSMQKGK